MPAATPLPTPDELRAKLDALKAGRGFLLPHHGALAAAAPDLHDAYGVMYRALTQTDRHLGAWEREFVWLCVLVAGREAVGTHHLDLFARAGGTQDQARLAVQLAGYAEAAATFAFVEAHWQAYLPDLAGPKGYLAGVERLCGDVVPLEAAHLALAAVQTLRRRKPGVAAHLGAIYGAHGPLAPLGEERMVEALSLVIWPGGVNAFVDACTVWQGLIATGAVAASERFRAWGEMPGLGAFARSDSPGG